MIRDVEAACPVCAHPAVQRFYDAVSFHSWTLAACRRALEHGGTGLAADCDQCGARVGEEDIVRWVVHTGFARGAGLVQGFAERKGERRWLLSPHERLDVQLVPRWDSGADASQRELAHLQADDVMRVFGRAFSPKEALRAWLLSTEDEERALTRLAPGLWALATYGSLDSDAARADIEAASGGASWVGVDLVRDGEADASAPHTAAGWLRGVEAALQERSVRAFARADDVEETLRAILARFPVQVPVERDGARLLLGVPGFAPGAVAIDPVAVATEAARSASDPADVARLELDRILWGVTGWGGPSEVS